MRALVLLAAALTAGSACGSGGDGAADAAPSDADPGAIDLANATWELEPVHESAQQSTDADLAFDSSGRPMVVWEEGTSAIGFAIREDGGWRTEMIDAQAPFDPHILAGAGGGAHIVFTASSSTTGPDIFYAHWDGSAVSSAVNLTGPQETDTDFDASPAVVELGGGGLAVLYYTQLSGTFGARILSQLSFSDPASPGSSDPILPPARNCGEIQALVAADGRLHVVTKCIPDTGDFEVVYLNDASGELMPQVVDPGPSRNLLAPDLAISRDGRVHVAFRGTLDCGPDLCTDIFYSANLAPARAVTGTPEENWEHPALILDNQDRIIVAFHKRDPKTLYWTFLDNGGFFRPRLIDSNAGTTESNAAGATDPTGIPWLAFERRVDTGPADIWLAHLVP